VQSFWQQKTLSLKLGEVITLEDFATPEPEAAERAWFVYDQGLMCWLIAAMPPSSDLFEDALKSQASLARCHSEATSRQHS